MKPATGPAAFLALFAPPECQALKHPSCSQRLCPCNRARTWLRSLPKSLSFKAIWNRIRRPDWLQWLAGYFGLGAEARGTCAEIRRAIPWERMAEAIAYPPAKTSAKCDRCGEDCDPDEIVDGRCEDCDADFNYCSVCDDRHHDDDLCDHLAWSNCGGYMVGTGADEGEDPESFHRALSLLGLKLTKALRADIAKGVFGTWDGDHALTERVKELREEARDTDDRDNTEAGLIWLDTIPGRKAFPTAHRAITKKTLAWIDAHIKARARAIASDRRPRRLIRDGAGRWWIDGAWTAVREQGRWMPRRQAIKLAQRLRAVYPHAGIKVVHVLTPAPAYVAPKGGSR